MDFKTVDFLCRRQKKSHVLKVSMQMKQNALW